MTSPRVTAAPSQDLAERCATLFAAEKLPGLAVSVVRSGADAQTAFCGHADVARQWPVDAATVFRIGSVGKTMTAIAVMQLVEAGRINLDDAVNHHLRRVRITPPAGSRDVTITDLLTHTSGLGPLRQTSDLLRPLTGLGTTVGAVPEPDEFYRDGLKGLTEPGTRWSYANHGFTVLGQLISDVSGAPYREYMATRVFAPLGMSGTALRLTPEIQGHLAVGYAVKKKGFTPVKYRDVIVEPAGSVFSNSIDMSLYLEALLGEGANRHGRVLEPATLALMTRPHFTCDSRLTGAFGLGFMVDEVAGHRTFWHSGGWPGFATMLYAFPDDGFGIVAFANALSRRLATTVAESLARFALDEPAAPTELTATAVGASTAQGLAGTYGPHEPLRVAPIRWAVTGGGGFKVVAKDGTLFLRTRLPVGAGAKPAPLVQTGDDPLVLEALLAGQRYQLAFQAGADGAVHGLCVNGLLSYRKL